MDKLKNQLTAAVAISAGALIASGYLITWARLANVDAPSRAVLSALSTSYYLGVALESLLLLLVLGRGRRWLLPGPEHWQDA
jgi:hypothetical protein